MYRAVLCAALLLHVCTLQQTIYKNVLRIVLTVLCSVEKVLLPCNMKRQINVIRIGVWEEIDADFQPNWILMQEYFKQTSKQMVLACGDEIMACRLVLDSEWILYSSGMKMQWPELDGVLWRGRRWSRISMPEPLNWNIAGFYHSYIL